ncbi:MAG: hypothetical protein AAFP90_23110, partial [Planctomycetota bacterium]
ASQWVGASKRRGLNGRQQESVIGHAYGLLLVAERMAVGVRELEIRGNRRELGEQISASYRTLLHRQFGAPEKNAADVASNANPLDGGALLAPPAAGGVAAVPGMTARLAIAGADAGIRMRYGNSVQFSEAVVAAINDHLKRENRIPPDGRYKLNCIGILNLPRATTLRLATTLDAVNSRQSVRVNNTDTGISALVKNKDIDLAPGRHRIHWTIETSNLKGIAFGILNADNGQRIDVYAPPDATNLRTPLTIRLNGAQ